MKKIITAMSLGVGAMVANAACPTPTLNTQLWWTGSGKVEQVNTVGTVFEWAADFSTGDGCQSTMGYWFDYDDRKNDHGNSYAVYPFEKNADGSAIKPMMEEYGYVTIDYVLNEPQAGAQGEWPYNFVGFGFNAVSAKKEDFDMSALNGLCITYTSTIDAKLEIQAPLSGDHSCMATMAATETPKKLDALKGSDFEQEDWGDKGKATTFQNGCADAFKNVIAVKIKLAGANGAAAKGRLRVFEIGPSGTCTGAGSVAASEAASFTFKSDGDGGIAPGGSDAIVASKAFNNAKVTLSGRTLSFVGADNAHFEIVSLQGQVVKSGIASASVSLSNLNAGVYMVRVAGKSVNMSQKILVK